MSIYYFIIIGVIVGYLCGSIPFALIIGKIFYKTDVRNYGSGNLGSTNVGRTLGPVAGITCMIIDITKAGVPALIMYKIAEASLLKNIVLFQPNDLSFLSIVYCATGLASCIGHCFPIFAQFKGGKAVASIAGFIACMNYKLAIVAFGVYLVVFLIGKIISLSSISTAVATLIASFIPFFKDCYLFTHNELNNSISLIVFHITLAALALLLILRHLPNIRRILKGEEKKFKFEHKSRN